MTTSDPEPEPPAGLANGARALARLHALSDQRPDPIPSLAGIGQLRSWLEEAQTALAPEPAAGRAAEWLFDNAYRIERAARQIGEDLPRGFYLRLPALVIQGTARPPRIYALAQAIARATNLQLTADSIARFVASYQEIDRLRLAELWALPTLLRLTCLELLVSSLERLAPDLSAPIAIADIEGLPLRLDDTECIARSIRALGSLDAIDWSGFVQATSAIESVLRNDPAGAYPKTDAETRDTCRRAVEELAARSHHGESEVAERVLAHSRRAGGDSRAGHVGYWLLAEGRSQLEQSLRYRPSLRTQLRRGLRRRATGIYLGSLVSVTGLFVLLPAVYLAAIGAGPATLLAALALLVLPASMLSLTVVHWTLSRSLPPTVLPKLAFEGGIPADARTAVVIPSLIVTSRDVEHLLGQIERHYLSNPEPHLQFVLLTGFAEADEPHRPEDADLRAGTVRGIRALNRRHGVDGNGPFHLFHRERRFNPVEGRWMGWERKRGKLDEFNRILLGDEETSFELHEGRRSELDDIRFVITLDADTALPQGTGSRLVATLSHPLNRAVSDPDTGRVRSGYTVIQPRVETSPESGNRSLFTRVYCGDTAIDIYSRAVSDVYQDLFGTGIYVGKAIYDVAAFSESLAGRAPENALASHDLFEGIHGRAALATDIVLYEDYPPSYLAFSRRLHRWVRGDWQLVPWLRRRVPGAQRDYLPNRFAGIDRWKILDNLRRSLLPAGLLATFISGWTWLPGHPLVWTLLALLAPAGHLFIDFATGLARERWRPSPEFSSSLSEDASRWLLMLVFLPHQAAVTVDAIARTLVRVTLTKRRLLEWTTAAHTAESISRRHPTLLTWSEMAVAPITAIVTGAIVLTWRPEALIVALPLLVLWAASPEIARRMSQPRVLRREKLDADDAVFLRGVARRTWLFFESFVGPEGHWLPPDNYQEDPGHVIAHRTSPTNIGMLLLSTLGACDLGYISLEQLALRLRHTLRSVARLEHYRGHLLNWYHTRTLEPLPPRYVSTVDSGNFAVALLTIEAGISEMLHEPALRNVRWLGLADTILLLRDSLARLLPEQDAAGLTEAAKRVDAMQRLALGESREPRERANSLKPIEAACSELEAILLDLVANRRMTVDLDALHEVRTGVGRVHDHLRTMQHEVESLAPWLGLLEATPSLPAHHPAKGVPERVHGELDELLAPSVPLRRLAQCREDAMRVIDRARAELGRATEGADSGRQQVGSWLDELATSVTTGTDAARRIVDDLERLASQAEREALGMDFTLLYDRRARHLFIGYNVTANEMDANHYDLLASEARLASLIAIAKGDVPAEHWFSLDRPLTRAGQKIALLSWGGTMFEYLLPPLLMRSQPGTLLAESERAAVLEQIAHGDRQNLPWGVSESGFAAFDADHNYQYQAFGVQALGRKRGLDEDRVVTPYATALALPLFPASAVSNLRRLCDLGMLGQYGFYEAIDFTPARLVEARDHAIVRSHMAHHQGMVLASILNLLCDDALVRRFGANPRVQAADLLLQERVPGRFPIESPQPLRSRVDRAPTDRPTALAAWRPSAAPDAEDIHLLGNGRLASRISASGAGSLSWRGQAITRPSLRLGLGDAGPWIYVRDTEEDATWSIGQQPTGRDGAEIDVVFHAHMVELHRRQHGIAIRTDIAIGAADDIEVRRITVVNETNRPRSLAFTSYGEVVLAPAREDAQHPAFSKLSVEAVHLPSLDALLFLRRPRKPSQHCPVALHRMIADSTSIRGAGFETDRERFLGRRGTHRRPRALDQQLSGSQGATLDPIMALRAEVELAPFATEQLAFVTIAGPSRQSVVEAATRYETLASVDWLLSDAHAETAREVGRLSLPPARLPELQVLLGRVLAPHAELRATKRDILENRQGQQGLWALGISGDDPILLVETAVGSGALLPDLVRAHPLWRRRGFAVDLVILTTAATGYWDETRGDVQRLLEELGAAEWLGRRAGIHLVRSDQITREQRLLLSVAAGAILDADGAPLREQLAPRDPGRRPLPRLDPSREATRRESAPRLLRPTDLRFENGFGGFTPDGREYVIQLGPGEVTPAPWCNVLANEGFGTIVTESGGGYSWADNSAEYRLSPWSNDPVRDPESEALYLRDEETTEVWSPTPGPAGSDRDCQIRHGAGYSEWRQNGRGLSTRLRVFVPVDDPVKIVELRVRNHEQRPRRLTATYYVHWLLGRVLAESAPHVVVTHHVPTGSLFARNHWNAAFADRVAFLTSDREPHGLTADRMEFLGPEGDRRAPAALRRVGLSGSVGPGLDPCAALQVHLDLGPGEEVCTHFVLGTGLGEEHAAALAQRWRSPAAVSEAAHELDAHWDGLLSAVTVRTPEPAMDLLINRWALYQAISSRVLARAGFYQSSGAFGFRDQLQDVLALLVCDPARTRRHLLECASRQFEEGDVLHWWHPPEGRGVRTRCSDDLLWLPYATACYVKATGDVGVLDEEVPFLSAPPLAEDEHERYELFQHGEARGPLFEHCRRALERGLTRGTHGLPLIGDGDWNDGLDRVGFEGVGESVWLAWFGGATAEAFGDLCRRRGEDDAAKAWHQRAEALFSAAEETGWDGEWYRRAFDDEGKPWGSATSEECRIDSIAQSWAVLSGGARRERAVRALRSAESALIREEGQLACLLWPPFDLTPRDPGYIKAYPPGIRENGGQYSHAAAWLGWALAETGDGDRAARVFRLLNPIERTQSPEAARRYRVEPYAVAADIASVAPHVGRGGWSWYTGAAAWSWRLGVEAILGLRREGDGLRIEPCLPRHWPGFEATVRIGSAVLEIVVDNTQAASGNTVEIVVDGEPIDGHVVELPTEALTRRVAVSIGAVREDFTPPNAPNE